ncbi:glycosyltransferase [Pseudoduganella namucuonensis]
MVSHSFIRREIQALERRGVEIERIALRGWRADLRDDGDKLERQKTRYVLQGVLSRLIWTALLVALLHPLRCGGALALALKLARGSQQFWPVHLAYLAEACVVARWLKQTKANHLHAHFGTNSAEVAMLASHISGVPYSFTVHGPDEFDRPVAIGLKEKVRRSAFVVAVSSFGRSQLFRWIESSDWPKVKIVHCGLEPDFHNFAVGPLRNHRRLVCVGRLCAQKGQLLLLQAASLLANRGVAFEIVLAGDGEQRELIDSEIERLGLTEHVHVTGWISSDEVRDTLLSARGMVLPSFAEGLPVVIMEAMSLRRPVLTTYIAGIPELVLHGVNGWLFPSGCVEALAAAIQVCLDTPAEEIEVMGEQARQRILERHDIDQQASNIATLFGRSDVSIARKRA